MRANLIALAQAYAENTGRSLASVSKEVHGNQAFLLRFANSEISVRLDTYFKIINRIRKGWPDHAPWPVTSAIPKLGKIIDGPVDDD